jgi:hypothetical protein
MSITLISGAFVTSRSYKFVNCKQMRVKTFLCSHVQSLNMVALLLFAFQAQVFCDEAIYVQFSHTEIKMRWHCEVAFNWCVGSVARGLTNSDTYGTVSL